MRHLVHGIGLVDPILPALASSPDGAGGRSPRGPAAQAADGSFTSALTHDARCGVVLVQPATEPYELTTESLQLLPSGRESH